MHKTLELAGDKFYMITCGKAGFQNSRYVLKMKKSKSREFLARSNQKNLLDLRPARRADSAQA